MAYRCIPSVIDNYVTAIISIQCRLFIDQLIPTYVTLETAEGLTTMTKRFGRMKLLLSGDANKHHSYIIPCCVFYPKTPVNILSVPALGTFFCDNEDATDPLADDGTTIKLGFTKSHFI